MKQIGLQGGAGLFVLQSSPPRATASKDSAASVLASPDYSLGGPFRTGFRASSANRSNGTRSERGTWLLAWLEVLCAKGPEMIADQDLMITVQTNSQPPEGTDKLGEAVNTLYEIVRKPKAN